MLDVQRYRGAILRKEVHFARKILLSHVGFAILAIGLFLFHGYVRWSLMAALWFLISLFLMSGITHGSHGCRVALGLLFLVFASGGLLFLVWYLPEYPPRLEPMLPVALAPFWLGLLNLAYISGGLVMLISNRFRKAATIGFSLW